jgi:hypothetical protein
MTLPINFATVAYVHDSYGLGGVINLVDDPVVAGTNPPGFAASQFITSRWPRIFLQSFNFEFSSVA